MLLATEQSIRQRVNMLRAEIADISRLNEEYPHISHTLPVRKIHTERLDRLEQIVMELKSLSTHREISAQSSFDEKDGEAEKCSEQR
jgi:hypothetical protein